MNENKSAILHLLSNNAYFRLSKVLIKGIGLQETYVLTELIDKREYFRKMNQLDEEGCFFYTREKMEENLDMSHTFQRSVLKKLKELDFIDMHTRGMPPKTYYRIYDNNIETYIESRL